MRMPCVRKVKIERIEYEVTSSQKVIYKQASSFNPAIDDPSVHIVLARCATVSLVEFQVISSSVHGIPGTHADVTPRTCHVLKFGTRGDRLLLLIHLVLKPTISSSRARNTVTYPNFAQRIAPSCQQRPSQKPAHQRSNVSQKPANPAPLRSVFPLLPPISIPHDLTHPFCLQPVTRLWKVHRSAVHGRLEGDV